MSEIPWDIIGNLGWIASLLAILGGIWKVASWNKGIEVKIAEMNGRLERIEKNPILLAMNQMSVKMWSNILHDFEQKFVENPLTPDEVRRRRELTAKLDTKTITPDEAKELHDILNEELEEARAANNIIAFFAILFLLGLLAAALSR